MNHNAQPFTYRSGIVLLTQALSTMPSSLTLIWQPLSAWEEHRVHIDLFSVGAESFEMEICEGN